MSSNNRESAFLPTTEGLPRISVSAVTQAGAKRVLRRDHCACLSARTRRSKLSVPTLHQEPQDRTAPGWEQTIALMESLATEGARIFEPSASIPWEEWIKVITLPSEIATLKTVEEIRLYGSHLRRLPPEIGALSALVDLDIYTSYSLHWLPYEVVRCPKLCRSRMSTRALYGNFKTKLPFPRLGRPIEALMPATCSVCDRPFGDRAPQLHWITLRVATDVVPLLIHSCSRECMLSVPTPPAGYFQRPHKGGGGVGVPDLGDPVFDRSLLRIRVPPDGG